MAQLFGHEKLKVYQKGMGFAVIRGALRQGTTLIVERKAYWSILLRPAVRGLRRTESYTWGTPTDLHWSAPHA